MKYDVSFIAARKCIGFQELLYLWKSVGGETCNCFETADSENQFHPKNVLLCTKKKKRKNLLGIWNIWYILRQTNSKLHMQIN